MVVPLAISAIRQRTRRRKVAEQNFDRRLLDDEEFFKKMNLRTSDENPHQVEYKTSCTCKKFSCTC